jgi:O-antigen ligase
MLASSPVRTAGLRVDVLVPALAAATAVVCAVFFGGGDADAPLVWIGAIAFLAAVLLLVRPPRLEAPGRLLLGSLFGLAAWCGLSTIWSTSPDASWTTTNRTLVYAVFALLGAVVAARRETLATAAAVLLGALVTWALVVKCIPPLYSDYDRIARLRAPLEYWNELALLCAAGLPVGLWLAAARRRVEGVLLVYGLTVALLLTYSRFGVALGFAAAVVWVVLDRRRVESLASLVVAAVPAVGVFGVALALPGITQDGVTRAARDRDGWIFALVLLAGAAVAAAAALALRDREVAPERRRQIERGAAVAAGVLVVAAVVASVVLGGRIWSDFTSPGGQLANDYARLGSVRSNRWTWWQEAWHAFTRHPLGGTGAGTFELTNKLLRNAPIEVDDPHNTPLRFLSETGIVGFLLFLGAAGGALWGAWRARLDAAGLALGIGVAAFFLHTVIDKDWNYVAGAAPCLFVAGALTSSPREAPRVQRRLVAVAAAGIALAASYSLVAPWLAQRELANAATASGFQRAHSYDPLSVDALLDWAAYEEGAGRLEKAASLYRQATSLEPENASAWYELGAFYFRLRLWRLAYDALNTSYTYDRFGRASIHCGLLDRARWNAGFRFGVRCPGEARASSP